MKSKSELPAKDRILYKAHDLFYHHGIRATGIDRIIAESGVTKVTFYRHFPSKNDLVLAYLDYRHERWMTCFKQALERYGKDFHALVPAMAEWFRSGEYRGCAFINTVGELANDLPEVLDMTRRHKRDMTFLIYDVLPDTVGRTTMASALAIAIDGAIIHAQYDTTPDSALQGLARIAEALAS